ncbi:MAG TPA: hypothetical protein VEQ58_14970 [Polyangiaceae bacterium]|nr:hypothetical protein [Polyangiaceae bacterium]
MGARGGEAEHATGPASLHAHLAWGHHKEEKAPAGGGGHAHGGGMGGDF